MSMYPLALIVLLAFLWLIIAVLSVWFALSPRRKEPPAPRETAEDALRRDAQRTPGTPAVYVAPPRPVPDSPPPEKSERDTAQEDGKRPRTAGDAFERFLSPKDDDFDF